MPLFDHFSPPLSRERHWEAFHSAWANEIVRLLNLELLPERFVAEPHVRLGTRVEIDVAALDQGTFTVNNGGVALATHAPPKPTLSFIADWGEQDTFEIRLQKDEGGLTLVAAIELVSPANKDRPSHREMFVRKCASYLNQGIALIVIDVVPRGPGNLHADLLKVLGHNIDVAVDAPNLFASSYRALPAASETRVDVWSQPLQLGDVLPTLPLWLDVDGAVSLDFDECYRATCETLRIR